MKHRQILRLGLGILLPLLLCLTLLPMTVLAATPEETADFTIGDGSAALALLNAAKTAGAEDSTWENNTLTLNGVDFTSNADIAVILPGGATIELVGDNTITNANSNTGKESSYGIYVEGNLTIGGSGTLTVTGGMSVFSDGIYVSSYYNGESRVGGRLTITGGTVTARGGKAKYSYGIYTDGGVTISGGKVEAIGATTDNGSSIGVDTNKDVVITGGTVTARGSEAADNSFGIRTGYNFSLTISGGTLTATSDTANYSYGIYTKGGVTISGGHVIAQTLAKTASFASALSSKPDLSKYAGYQWCIIPNGKFTSSTDTAYTYNASHTYVEFAKGSAVTTYTVSFNANGGSGSMDAVTGVSGSYTLPANGFTAPYGKQFKGWAVSAGGTVITNTSIAVTENTTLYAVWEDIPVTTYTVTFNANGGSVTPAGAEAGEDGKPESLPTPTREGYTFDGWFTAADGGEKVTTDTVFEQNTTIYAHWTQNVIPPAPETKYTVTLDANGGSVTPAGAETGEDGKPESLPTPTREGYTFDGWFTAADGGEKVTADTVFEQNTTIYAHWTKESTGVNSDDSSSGSGSGDNTGGGSLPSDKPDSGKAQTDDTAMPMVMVGVAILALAALVVLVVLFVMKKRQSRKG